MSNKIYCFVGNTENYKDYVDIIKEETEKYVPVELDRVYKLGLSLKTTEEFLDEYEFEILFPNIISHGTIDDITKSILVKLTTDKEYAVNDALDYLEEFKVYIKNVKFGKFLSIIPYCLYKPDYFYVMSENEEQDLNQEKIYFVAFFRDDSTEEVPSVVIYGTKQFITNKITEIIKSHMNDGDLKNCLHTYFKTIKCNRHISNSEECDQDSEECDQDSEECDQKIEECDQKLEECDQKLEECDQDLEECDQKIEECDQKLEECDQKLEECVSVNYDYNLFKQEIMEFLNKYKTTSIIEEEFMIFRRSQIFY